MNWNISILFKDLKFVETLPLWMGVWFGVCVCVCE